MDVQNLIDQPTTGRGNSIAVRRASALQFLENQRRRG